MAKNLMRKKIIKITQRHKAAKIKGKDSILRILNGEIK